MGRSVPTSRNKMTQHAAASVNSTAPFNIPFMPAALHGHNMDHTTYRTRQQRATDHHLAALLSSKEYLAFKATKDQHSMQRRVWFRRGIWGALGMAVIVLLSSMAARGVFMNGVGQHGGGIQVQQVCVICRRVLHVSCVEPPRCVVSQGGMYTTRLLHTTG